jgi:hypothetical protein
MKNTKIPAMLCNKALLIIKLIKMFGNLLNQVCSDFKEN